jgi:hypothetical protein
MVTHLTISALPQQRDILKWRGLRAAAQEGYLHLLNKTKDSKDTYVIGDLEKLQVKIQNAEAEAATKATTPAPMLNVAASAPSDLGEFAKLDTGGTDDGVSMDVDTKDPEEDVKPVVTEPSRSGPTTGARVTITQVAHDVEMTEDKAEVKTEEQ